MDVQDSHNSEAFVDIDQTRDDWKTLKVEIQRIKFHGCFLQVFVISEIS